MTQKTRQVIDAESFFAVTHVSRETMARLTDYESSLQKWQKAINLVAKSTLETAWSRHFLDSYQLATLVPEDARLCVDLGSGGGFPGLVLAILFADRPGFQMHLVESDQRKGAFLREVARKTGAPATVHTARIEKVGASGVLGTADLVSARACAPLDRLFDWSEPFFGPGTVGLFPKGTNVQGELTDAQKSWTFTYEKLPSLVQADSTILKVEDLSRD